MTHYIVAPAIDLEMTKGFIESLDDDIRYRRLILIDNTDDRVIDDAYDWGIHAPGRNLGVAASWNWGVRAALSSGADMVTLASTAIRFDDGAQALCRTADLAIENGQWPYGFESKNGWHLITLGRRTFEEVGYFDEAFYPAYLEDCDYIWRMRVVGILEPAGKDRTLRKIPWIGALDYELVEVAHAIKRAGVQVDFVGLQEYYTRKWKGPPGEECYTIPFDGKTGT